MKNQRDRGMMKWRPAAFLPEQVEMHKQLDRDLLRREKPVLDEDQIADIEIALHHALQENDLLSIEVWEDGFPKKIKGYVHYLDHLQGKIRVKTEQELIKNILFTDIVHIESN